MDSSPGGIKVEPRRDSVTPPSDTVNRDGCDLRCRAARGQRSSAVSKPYDETREGEEGHRE
jgi:hypothetical protein